MSDSGPLWDGARGIVLDAVGTLIDPRPSVTEAYVMAANRQGIRLDPDVVRGRFARSFGADEDAEGRGPMATDEATERKRWRRIVEEVLPELPGPDRGFLELWEHFACPTAWRCFPDVAPFLEETRALGLSIAVASNFDARLRGVVAGLPELSALSGRLVISSEVGRRKPHPALYEAVAQRLALPPASILWVGDDVENDGKGPRDNGFRSVVIDRKGAGTNFRPTYPDLQQLLSERRKPWRDSP